MRFPGHFLKWALALMFSFAWAPILKAELRTLPAHVPMVRATTPPDGARNLCETYSWACRRGSQKNLPVERAIEFVRKINLDVNRKIRSQSDQRQYGREEYWTLPESRRGDCEDYALLKKRLLLAKGIDPSRLLLATVLDTRMSSHAVLVIRRPSGDYVLDNLSNRILHWSETGYVFLRIQDPEAPHRWFMVMRGGRVDDAMQRRGSMNQPTSSLGRALAPPSRLVLP